MTDNDTALDASAKARLAVAWTIVGVPLAYGVIATVQRSWALFTG